MKGMLDLPGRQSIRKREPASQTKNGNQVAWLPLDRTPWWCFPVGM